MKKINNLSYFRKKKGLTQNDLADLVNVAQSSLARYENGSMQPTLEVIKKIASVLSVSIDELFNGSISDDWELKIKVAKEGVIDVSGLKPSAEISMGDRGIALTLSGSYELWADDTKFENFIEQLKSKRQAALKFYQEAF